MKTTKTVRATALVVVLFFLQACAWMNIHSVPDHPERTVHQKRYTTECQENVESLSILPDVLGAGISLILTLVGGLGWALEPDDPDVAFAQIAFGIGVLPLALSTASIIYGGSNVRRCKEFLKLVETDPLATNAPPAAVTPKPVKPSTPTATPESEPPPVTAPTTP